MSKKIYRLEVSPEAYLAMEAEAFLRGRTLKEVASDILLSHCSEEAKAIVDMKSQNSMNALLPLPLLVKRMNEQYSKQTAMEQNAES